MYGGLVRPTDRFYSASLAKQITGAAAAVLVREGRLDPDLPVAHYLPNLPGWAEDITAHQPIIPQACQEREKLSLPIRTGPMDSF